MNTIDNTLSLDDLIAKLNILTTDFIFSKQQCRHRVCSISSLLRLICEHKELVFFPEQQIVYCKMLKVWQALAHEVPKNEQPKEHHQTAHTKQVALH